MDTTWSSFDLCWLSPPDGLWTLGGLELLDAEPCQRDISEDPTLEVLVLDVASINEAWLRFEIAEMESEDGGLQKVVLEVVDVQPADVHSDDRTLELIVVMVPKTDPDEPEPDPSMGVAYDDAA